MRKRSLANEAQEDNEEENLSKKRPKIYGNKNSSGFDAKQHTYKSTNPTKKYQNPCANIVKFFPKDTGAIDYNPTKNSDLFKPLNFNEHEDEKDKKSQKEKLHRVKSLYTDSDFELDKEVSKITSTMLNIKI